MTKSLWDYPLAIAGIAFVVGTAFAWAVYADDGVEALIYGVVVGIGGYLAARTLRSGRDLDEAPSDTGPSDASSDDAP